MNNIAHTTSTDQLPTITAPSVPRHHYTGTGVLSLGEFLQQHSEPVPSLIEPGLLPSSGILFLGGEPKLGKSLLAANLALGFSLRLITRQLPDSCPAPRSDLSIRVASIAVCCTARHDAATDWLGRGFQSVRRHGSRRASAEHAKRGLDHFLGSARAANAEVIVLDPLYSTHDQDENDTRAMTALCQSLLRLRDGSGAALIVIHHVRKSVGRDEIGSAFRGSSALHAVGDSYVLLTRISAHVPTVDLRFQFRYEAAPPPRLLSLDPETLWFDACISTPAPVHAQRKVDHADVQRALAASGSARFNQLRQRIMDQSECSRRTAQLAIQRACEQGSIINDGGVYRLTS